MTRPRIGAYRALAIFTDPPGSAAAALLQLVIPIGIAYAVLSLALSWTGTRWATLTDVAWAYLLLAAIRQRDHARARLPRVEDREVR